MCSTLCAHLKDSEINRAALHADENDGCCSEQFETTRLRVIKEVRTVIHVDL